MELSKDQYRAVCVLGFLYLRMGLCERAMIVFRALLALNPDDNWARRNLAFVALDQGKSSDALRLLDEVFEKNVLSTKDAPFLLLRARALWAQDRKAEARAAIDEYFHLTGAPEA